MTQLRAGQYKVHRVPVPPPNVSHQKDPHLSVAEMWRAKKDTFENAVQIPTSVIRPDHYQSSGESSVEAAHVIKRVCMVSISFSMAKTLPKNFFFFFFFALYSYLLQSTHRLPTSEENSSRET